MVVLPAPVEPTKATFCPGSAVTFTLFKIVLPGVYPKLTFSMVILPFMG